MASRSAHQAQSSGGNAAVAATRCLLQVPHSAMDQFLAHGYSRNWTASRRRREVRAVAGMREQGSRLRGDDILPRQLDRVGHQARFVGPAAWHVPLRRAVLAQHPARMPLRDPECLSHPVDAPPATRRAQKFLLRKQHGNPDRSSGKAIMQTVESALSVRANRL